MTTPQFVTLRVYLEAKDDPLWQCEINSDFPFPRIGDSIRPFVAGWAKGDYRADLNSDRRFLVKNIEWNYILVNRIGSVGMVDLIVTEIEGSPA